MTPIRLLLVAAAAAAAAFYVLSRSSDDPEEAPSLQPSSSSSNSSVGTVSADLVAVPDAAPTPSDRQPADAPPTPTAPEPSTEAMPEPPVAVVVPAIELQRALVEEIAALQVELNELQKALPLLTTDAYQAAWDRNDFIEFKSFPQSEDIDGKLHAIRRSTTPGPYLMVVLPRAEFEDAYRVFDLIREKSGQIRKKQAELAAMPASARTD